MGKLTVGLVILALALLALSFVVERGPAAVASAPPASPAPTATLAPAAYGRALFQAKGCTSCHRHDGVAVVSPGTTNFTGDSLRGIGAPNLTDYQPDPEFLRVWLKDPRAVRPETVMPDLGLKEVEIEALIAFLGVEE